MESFLFVEKFDHIDEVPDLQEKKVDMSNSVDEINIEETEDSSLEILLEEKYNSGVNYGVELEKSRINLSIKSVLSGCENEISKISLARCMIAEELLRDLKSVTLKCISLFVMKNRVSLIEFELSRHFEAILKSVSSSGKIFVKSNSCTRTVIEHELSKSGITEVGYVPDDSLEFGSVEYSWDKGSYKNNFALALTALESTLTELTSWENNGGE